MFRLYLDPGHGGNDSGATGNGLQEKNIVLDIAQRIRTILEDNYSDVEVNMSRTGDQSVSLPQRTNEANAWGADYFLSIHCNAFNGSARGYEDFIYSGLSDSSPTARYQRIMHEEILAVNQLPDRGVKQANFHVLRESSMPALLTENGFIDNAQDANLMGDASWRQAVASGHVEGLARAFNLTRDDSDPDTLYKVIAGSFQNRENAENRVNELQTAEISSFITTMVVSGTTWYRVQAGSFRDRSNAERHLETVRSAGISDAYILVEGSENSEESPQNIMGETVLMSQELDAFVKTINPDAPILGLYYIDFGHYYGIRGDIAYAQALHETDYFRFTGVVDEEQNNFGGIGATDDDNPGATFETKAIGVLAQLQHLFAYASTDPLPSAYPLYDPRFDLVERGSATTWEGLNGKWAVPGETYGQMILNLYERMVEHARTT
ncbi:N-acetylmuramoyl-L-alanine amidase [Salicibibacter kimchii]|uniref:N-acetylmuramoyl-L-alanine amidase n=1 Tax=Salicibibacter kimchii TaxID=2099786 RepID=A0A345C2D8_9BACI|nr:N-acetylmuramoyl-L-alanine amidase [Salicibibacter kimchii]AXF57369.1 N-acetylmuramoyl-L-alanine amidase [Salicibibacter kimchii]